MKKRLPEAPDGLSDEAKGWWGKFVSGWDLDESALLILETALQALDRLREAQVELAKNGIVLLDRFGQSKLNPAVLVERDSRSAMLTALKSLGLDLEPVHSGPGRPSGR